MSRTIECSTKPSPAECCRIIFTFMREHEGIYRRAPHMNLTLTEWRRMKKLAKMGAEQAIVRKP